MPASVSPRPPSRRGPSVYLRTNSPALTTSSTSTDSLPYPSHLGANTATPPLETAYSRVSESSDTQPTVTTSRRQSRLNFRLFTRSKSRSRLDTPGFLVEEEGEAVRPTSIDQGAALPPSPDDPREDFLERPSAPRAKAKKEKMRSVMVTDPPPLFQAYPQAVKEGHLLAPVTDADTVLRSRARQTSEAEQESAIAAEAIDGSALPDASRDARKRINKRRTSAPLAVPCAPKLYILTTSGWLLQYADNGCHNRLPERIMQLRKDSAAFASDAIPGKHWVLQITQSSTEDGMVLDAPRASVFSKLSFGQDMKKPVGVFLLVMNSAEEMNSWLVTIRKEIQSLGGLEYRPDELAMSHGAHGPRASTDPHAGTQRSDLRARTVSQRASMYSLRSPPGGGLPPMSFTAASTDPENTPIPSGTMLSKRASMYAISPTNQPSARQQNWQPLVAPKAPQRSPLRGSFNLDKALPERPVDDAQARIDALGIINAEKLRRSHSTTPEEPAMTLRTQGIKPTLQSPKSPKFPVSAFNPDAHKFAADSPRASLDGARLHRFSFEKGASANPAAPLPINRPSHDRAESNRTRADSSAAPSLTDGESAPQESLPGDVPEREMPPSPTTTEAAPVTRAHRSASQPQGVRIELLPAAGAFRAPEAPQSKSGRRSRAPKETAKIMPGAVYDSPLLMGSQPTNPSQLAPNRYDSVPPARPNSAQGTAHRSVSPMPTGYGLRRPKTHQPKAGPRLPSTPQLPIGKPLTLQERRRISHRAIIVGPPTAPPPTSPLPALPQSAATPSVGAPTAPPTPPPFKETPPTLTASHFPHHPRKLPDSPPSGKLAPSSQASLGDGHTFTPQIYQEDDWKARTSTEAAVDRWS